MADASADAPETLIDRAQMGRGAAAQVRLWLAAIAVASREEEGWRDDAEKAVSLYRAGKRKDEGRRFNILYANTDTLVPALYNTPPVPDVRRRFSEDDPVAAMASRVLERALSLGSDEYDFDSELEAVTYDAYLTGRGVVRVRYKPWYAPEESETGPQPAAPDDTPEHEGAESPQFEAQEEAQERAVAWERAECEHVPWDTFRRGPARRWSDVPWVAFRHELTRDELRKLAPRIADKVALDAKDKHAPDEDQESGELFLRATVWEVWDREKRQVLFVSTGYKDAPLAVMDDPLGLESFFPCAEPVTFIRVPGSLVPVCPYTLYQDQAEELDRVTQRITALVKAIRWNGIYADPGLGSSLTALENAPDGHFVAAEGLQAILNGAGLDKALWTRPVDQAVAALRELIAHREAIKATIYEITGISDILRGATNASETATAQGIKAQWGSLRLQRMQKAIAKCARDILRLKAEIIAERFSPQTLSLLLGEPVPLEVMQLLRDQKIRPFRVDIETDSTIKADLSRAQQEYSAFLTGLGGLMQAALPVVQADPSMKPLMVTLIKSGARMFRLGRQAEEALDALPEQPPPPQPDPQAQAMQMKAEMDQRKAEMDMQATEAKTQAVVVQAQAKVQAAQAKHAMDMERMQMQAAMPQPLMVEGQQ